MDTSTAIRKRYEPPQLFRVDLNHEQAILSICSTGTNVPNNAANPRSCKHQGGGACKKDNSNGGNSGPKS